MRILSLIAPLALLAVVASCDKLADPSGGQVPFIINATGPVNLDAVGGAQLSIGVRVIGSGGFGLSGVPVKFTTASNNGSANPVTATTNTSGVATTTWTVASVTGDQTITATVEGLPSVIFTATVKAQAGTALAPRP